MNSILKSLFNKNILAFSLLINLPILFEPQMIAQFLSTGGISQIWVLWANAIGFAFGTVFIGPLWKKLPIKTENEIHLFRYEGAWSSFLTKFRSIYLGLIVIPLIGAQLILSFAAIASPVLGVSKSLTILLAGAFMVLILFSNNIKNRIRIDALIGLSSLSILLLVGLYWIFGQPDSPINHVDSNISLFNLDESLVNILFIFGFHWIATGIYDFPDMEGQKLLTSANKRDSRQLFRLIILMIIAQYFVYSLGYRAFMNFTGKELKGELIISDYINHSIPLIRYSLLLFVLIPFIGTISNFQLWSGTLISGLSSKQEVKFRRIGMVVFTVCSIVWSLSSESVWGIVQYLFVISAGVGPVFILRWYWHKITAKVQFLAMLSSLVYANLYIILEKNWIEFAQFSNDLSIRANLNPYFFQVFVVTIAVVFTWVLVTLLNKTDTKQAFNRFDAYSKGLESLKSKSNWSAFVFLAILIVSSRIFSWYLVIGEYLIATAFSLIMLFCLILYAYRLNNKQAEFDVKT
jgi:hypothetical protein